MTRELTDRERAIAAFMIDNATTVEGTALSPDERDALRTQLTTARAGEPCGCGKCPSIEIVPESEGTLQESSRVVLSMTIDKTWLKAWLLLFIDDGRLSYLELAPDDDSTVTEFPAVVDIAT